MTGLHPLDAFNNWYVTTANWYFSSSLSRHSYRTPISEVAAKTNKGAPRKRAKARVRKKMKPFQFLPSNKCEFERHKRQFLNYQQMIKGNFDILNRATNAMNGTWNCWKKLENYYFVKIMTKRRKKVRKPQNEIKHLLDEQTKVDALLSICLLAPIS